METPWGLAPGKTTTQAARASLLGPMAGLSLFPLTATHVLPYAMATVFLVIVLLLTPRLRA